MNAKTSPITREDIANKLREVAGEDKNSKNGPEQTVKLAALGVFLLVLAVSYFLGRRIGKRGRTIVEIKRV